MNRLSLKNDWLKVQGFKTFTGYLCIHTPQINEEKPKDVNMQLLDLETLEPRPNMPKNLPRTQFGFEVRVALLYNRMPHFTNILNSTY